MTQVIATFNIFNEAQFIKDAIEGVTWCDMVIVVDGAWQGFPTKSAYSDDGTAEIVTELCRQYHNIMYLKMREQTFGYEKVETYLKLINDGDYFIRLNGDEILEVDKDIKCPRKAFLDYVHKTDYLPLYTIPMYEHRKPCSLSYVPKILKKTPTLKVTARHVTMTNKFDPPYYTNSLPRGMVQPIQANMNMMVVRHMKEQRNAERQEANLVWLKNYYANQFKAGIV